ncbi:hypothetical protein THRCLA_08988 [Thraustotheca clavata]|uniref:Uncharacterized protein n=1 Tax=Thraustotheca clavata TaxID=74557 RepID=A0A1V9Z0M2_9STRA|nr:hypothetical protein THRCLA_08988 [Thraustotheca clavata]
MEIGVKCPTEGSIVPMNQGNLIMLSAKSGSNIILEPNWGLIAGLLCALFGVVAGLICGLYYFRRKSWVSKHSSTGGYKDIARNANLGNLHSKGTIVKKTAKTAENEAHEGSVLPDNVEAKGANEAAGNYVPELNRWDDDDLGIRELVDRLQFHHDSVEKAFHDQETSAVNMMKTLQNEADELKMLLASIVVAQKNTTKDKEAEGCDAELVLLDTLQKGMADRAEFEKELTTTQSIVVANANVLDEFINTSGNLTRTIIEEMATSLPSPIFQKLVSDLGALQTSVESELVPLVQTEINRRKVQRAVWKAFGSAAKDLLPLSLVESKQICEKAQAECDAKTVIASEYLRKFVGQVPAYLKKLHDFEMAFSNEWQQVAEQQNPALLKPLKLKYEKQLAVLLKDLQTGSGKLKVHIKSDNQALETTRTTVLPEIASFANELACLKDQLIQTSQAQATKEDKPTADVQELVNQLRGLLSNPEKLQLLNPVMPALDIGKMIDEAQTPQYASQEAEEIDFFDQSDELVMDDELQNDFDQEDSQVDELREKFMADLEKKQNLPEEERQQLLEEFNEDMANLQMSMKLEREKHQEQLRNRLAIRKLKKDSDILLNEEALEENILEKQEAEMKALELAFEEEQAKIEAEFEASMRHLQGSSRSLLATSRSPDVLSGLPKEMNQKWNEKSSLLREEYDMTKRRVAARTKNRKEIAISPEVVALLDTMSTIEQNHIDRKFDIEQGKCFNDMIKMSAGSPKLQEKVLQSHEMKWETRRQNLVKDEALWQQKLQEFKKSGKSLDPELLNACNVMSQTFQLAKDQIEYEKLLEKAMFSELSIEDQAKLEKESKQFHTKWLERSDSSSSLVNPTTKVMPGTSTAEDANDFALLREMCSESIVLGSIGAAIKSNQSLGDNEEEIQKIREVFEKDWARQQELLDSEADMRKKQLAARIKRRREANNSDSSSNDSKQKLFAMKEAMLSHENDLEIEIEREALNNAILTDKASLDQLTKADKASINMLLQDHDQKWMKRRKYVEEDYNSAKEIINSLNDESYNKSMTDILLESLQLDYDLKQDELDLSALVEKAQIGSLSTAETQQAIKIISSHDNKWKIHRAHIDTLEAQISSKKQVKPEVLEALKSTIQVSREKLEIRAMKESSQLNALQAALPSDDDAIAMLQDNYTKACADRKKDLEVEAELRKSKLAERLRRQRHGNESLSPEDKDKANSALEVEEQVDSRQIVLDTQIQKEAIDVKYLVEKVNGPEASEEDKIAIEKLLDEHEQKWSERTRLLKDDEALAKQALELRLKKRQNKVINSAEAKCHELHFEVVHEALATSALVEKSLLGMALSPEEANSLSMLGKNYEAKWHQRQEELNKAEADGKEILSLDPSTTAEEIADFESIIAKERELLDHQETLECAQLVATEQQMSEVIPPSTTTHIFDNDATITKLQDDYFSMRQKDQELMDNEAQYRRARLSERLQRKLKEKLSPGQDSSDLESLAAIETHTLEMDCATEKDAMKADILAKKKQLDSLSPEEYYDIEALLHDHEQKWADRNRILEDDRALARAKLKDRLKKQPNRAIASLNERALEDDFAIREEHLGVALLIENAKLGNLNSSEKHAIEMLFETHKARWQERLDHLNAIADTTEGLELSEALEDRVERQREIILAGAIAEKKQLDVLESALTEDDGVITKIHDIFKRDWSLMQKQLDDEAQMKRDNLLQRLQRQKKKQKCDNKQDKIATQNLDLELSLQQEALHTQILSEKSKNGLLTSDDAAMIAQILNDHDAKWKERERLLKDNQSLAKAHLIDRLNKRKNKNLNPIQDLAFNNACSTLEKKVELLKLLEKARLGLYDSTDATKLAGITTSNVSQQAALNTLEDELSKQLELSPDELDELHDMVDHVTKDIIANDVEQQKLINKIDIALKEPKKLKDYSSQIKEIMDKHDKDWKEQMKNLSDEEKRQRMKLHERLAKKKARDGFESKEEEDVLNEQITREMQLKRRNIELNRLLQKKKDGTLAAEDEAMIKQLLQEFGDSCRKLKDELSDDEKRLKLNLQNRLKGKRDLLANKSWPTVQSKVQALNELLEEERSGNDDIEHVIDMKGHGQSLLLGEQRTMLDQLRTVDDNTIAQLQADHELRWKKRQEELDDEAKRLRLRLKDRLQSRRDHNEKSNASLLEKQQVEKDIATDAALLEEALENQLAADFKLLETQRLAEKLRLGIHSEDDEATIKKILEEHAQEAEKRRKELDDEETRKKENLRSRLTAKHLLNQKGSKSQAEKDAMTLQLDALEVKEIQQIEDIMDAKRQVIVQESTAVAQELNQVATDYDSTIEKLINEHNLKKEERDRLLAHEEKRLRNRLKDRLTMRKRHGFITEAEENELQSQLEADLAAKKAESQLELLAEKANLKIANEQDEELIKKLQEDHGRSRKLRENELQDEETLLRDRLKERLAKKREKIQAINVPNKDALLHQLDDEEERENNIISEALDNKRKFFLVVPVLNKADREREIEKINMEHEKHSVEWQRMLNEEESLKKTRLRERMEKKRLARGQEAVTTSVDEAELAQEMAKIDAEMEIKRKIAAEEAQAEQQTLAASASQAILQAKANTQKQVEDMIEKVKSEHENELQILQQSLQADRAKQELALKDRIAARRNARLQEKADDNNAKEALRAEEEAEMKRLEQKLQKDEKAALEKAKKKVEDEIAALQRQAAANAEIQALKAAEEKKLAESEWLRLKKEHETELQNLQSTLDNEHRRQEQKLQDRIKQRRLAKEKELSECKEAEEIQRAQAALDEQDLIERENLDQQLAKQAEEALQEELERQREAEKHAAQKIASAAIEAAAATAAMDALRAVELDRVSNDYQAQMAQLQKVNEAEATSHKSKLEMRMAAKKQKKMIELQAKKEEEKRRLLEEQAAQAQVLRDTASQLAQTTALIESDQVKHEDELQKLKAKQESERKRLEEEAQRELEMAQKEIAEKMQRELETARVELQAQIQDAQSQIQVKAELERVQNEFHEKGKVLTDSLKLESTQKKKDLMRRLEEKKRKKTDDLLAKQQDERQAALLAQKEKQESVALNLEREKEIAMIQKLLSQNKVLLSQLKTIIERVVEKRHKREQSLLFARQYRERSGCLRESLQQLMIV